MCFFLYNVCGFWTSNWLGFFIHIGLGIGLRFLYFVLVWCSFCYLLRLYVNVCKWFLSFSLWFDRCYYVVLYAHSHMCVLMWWHILWVLWCVFVIFFVCFFLMSFMIAVMSGSCQYIGEGACLFHLFECWAVLALFFVY